MTGPVPDAGVEAQRAAELHLDACWEAMDLEEESAGEDEAAAVEWPDTAGPFCGCRTCEVREVLYVAVPILLADAQRVLVDAGHPDAATILAEEYRP
jgi:hypothetical protein